MGGLSDFSRLSPVRAVVAIVIALVWCMSYGQEPVQWKRGQNTKTAQTAPKRKASLSLHPKSYTRPKPTKPIKPYMPSVNRLQPGKFFLEPTASTPAKTGTLPGR